MGLVEDSGEFKVDFGRYFVRLFEWIPATAYAWIPATAYAWIPATAYAWIPAKESHHHTQQNSIINSMIKLPK